VGSKQAEPAAPVDEYALAREIEARRREKMFAARSTGRTESRPHEHLATTKESRAEAEPKKPEKKMEDDKVTKPRAKPRASRTAREEIERYDPKKKFGRGG